MKLIGIHGKKKSGKDTFADEIINQFHAKGLYPKKMAFADNLKKVCATLFHMPEEWFYAEYLKEQVHPDIGLSPRRIMVNMSEALRPKFGDDLFIRPVRERYNSLKGMGSSIKCPALIVTDVRGEHEADWIRSSGGIMLHLERAGYRDEGEVVNHWSEAGIAFKERDVKFVIPEGLPNVTLAVTDFLENYYNS